MNNIFFTSDTHYAHANIASRNTSKWKAGYRKYHSLEEMNQELVKAINRAVGPDDTLYHLGDWSFGGIENIWNFRKQINCKDIHLILGNHDHHIEQYKILPNCHYNYLGDLIEGGNPNPTIESQFAEAADLFSTVSHYKEVNINGQVYVLSHYPFAVWHGNGKGWRHLHGHSHGSFNSIGLSIDVGVDEALRRFGEPRPFHVDEIEEYMRSKSITLLDHHSSETNTGKRPR